MAVVLDIRIGKTTPTSGIDPLMKKADLRPMSTKAVISIAKERMSIPKSTTT